MLNLALSSLCTLVLTAPAKPIDFQSIDGGFVWAHGQLWPSLADWHNSHQFRTQYGRGCGAALTQEQFRQGREARGADCSSTANNPANSYDPTSGSYEIKLVFHVICANDSSDVTQCTGYISPSTIQQQVDVLNADFAGQNNSLADDTRIQFSLHGISWVRNTFWHQDSEAARSEFFSSLNVDKDRYTNIYINSGSGLLGQATYPYGGVAGTTDDFVMIAYDTLPGSGGNFGLGRTLVHELGHSYGLYHTFGGPNQSDESTCPVGGCNDTGDLCCDTEPEQNSSSGCSQRNTCGDPDPITNFMNYTHDSCMTMFSDEQGTRMRCTIQTYRPQLVDGSSGAAIGACCTGTNCFIAHESSCQSVLGTWQGPATSCEDFICNETNAIGACCSGSNCADLLTLSECNAAGGVWQGELTTCGGVSCSGTNPTGACCQNTTCTNGWSASDCAAAGGTWQGASVDCSTVSCDLPDDPTGACCQGLNCAPDLTDQECTDAGGSWQGASSTCASVTCESSNATGACCQGLNCAADMTSDECTDAGGIWQGESTTCSTVNCGGGNGDTCTTAIVVDAGTHPYSTIDLSLSNLAYNDQTCDDQWARIFGPDIFFSWRPEGAGSVSVNTCDPDSFDTSLFAYRGVDCNALEQIACDGDSGETLLEGCQPYASITRFGIESQAHYIIRVGGYSSSELGAGMIHITPCYGDVNADSTVQLDDLVLILDAWSSSNPELDVSGDAQIGLTDLLLLLQSWGDCP